MSANRLHELIVDTQIHGVTGGASAVSPAAVEDTRTPPIAASVAPEPAAALYAVRERVLSPPQTLLYYLLKTGLPEHVVLVRPSLSAILETGRGLSGLAREEQVRRLAALSVDFVVADKAMHPLAVVELSRTEDDAAGESERAAARTRLSAAGIRYLSFDANALPRKEALRALVLEHEPVPESHDAASDVAT